MKPQTVELELSPVDNRALANLCGALDANLRQVEAALDVTIARRGSAITLRGASPQVQQAATALQRFYAHAAEPLSVDDIQLGLIELATQRTADAAPSEDHDDAPAQLRTRRADLHGRTPNQILYLRHIQEHDITFGIGPAGTGKTYL
ncbi:MAG TPA: PhoH family protein, partial [Casimicrobiaceae bacterium]|nr:PhoH family protein [Casimicrobiaceae bacterium]